MTNGWSSSSAYLSPFRSTALTTSDGGVAFAAGVPLAAEFTLFRVGLAPGVGLAGRLKFEAGNVKLKFFQNFNLWECLCMRPGMNTGDEILASTLAGVRSRAGRLSTFSTCWWLICGMELVTMY